MLRFFAVFLLLFLILNSCTHTDPANRVNPGKKAKNDYNLNIKIPPEWIEKIRHYNYKQNNASLLHEFDDFAGADSLFVPDYYERVEKKNGGILNPMFTNLDGESTDELICLLGWNENYPSLAVFKEIQGDWRLLYLEPFYMFYSMPEFAVANNFSKNKTFYFRRMNEHGSDVYSDGYSFYKLVNNKVYKCLDLINEAHIDGWGLFMNQEVKMSFKFNGGNADEIWVWFTYKFFPGAVKQGDCPWCSNSDISLVQGEQGMNYQWDGTRMVYKPETDANQDSTELTSQKIACFGDFGNDTLFVHAFHAEINQALKKGTPELKKILKQYLALVNKKGHATTEEMEETTEAGGTKFYRPKKKK